MTQALVCAREMALAGRFVQWMTLAMLYQETMGALAALSPVAMLAVRHSSVEGKEVELSMSLRAMVLELVARM